MKEKWTMKMIYTNFFPTVTSNTTFFHTSAGDLSYAEQLSHGKHVNQHVDFLYVTPSLVELCRATTH